MIYIAGPCVLEDEETALSIAQELKEITSQYEGVDFVFKASYDKANRTLLSSYRGPGLKEGLRILAAVKEKLGLRILTDVHETCHVSAVAEVVDIIQIPAFLCRQTDLLVAAAKSGKMVNVKRGQFMAPWDMQYTLDKIRDSGNGDILLTERGSSFGYNNLVVDFRALTIMRELGVPVIFDATHAVQVPSQGGTSGGNREYIAPLSRAAAAYGIDGLFTEVYPNPDDAKCDGSNSLPLAAVPELLDVIMGIRGLVEERD